MNFYMRVVCYRPVSLEQFFLKWLDWEKPYSPHDKLEEEYRKYIGW